MTTRRIVLGGLLAWTLAACESDPPAVAPPTPRDPPKAEAQHDGDGGARAVGSPDTPRKGLAAVVADQVAGSKREDKQFPEAKAEAPPEPSVLPPPTPEEFAAWNSRDPRPKLSLWDGDHLDLLVALFEHLHCAREEMRVAGQAYLDSGDESAWFEHKRAQVIALDQWQASLFAKHRRIPETSKLVGTLLEAHELVSYGYPRAFNSGKAEDLAKADAQWTVVDDKATAALASGGATLSAPTPAECAAAKEAE